MRSESKARFRRPRRVEVVSVQSNFLPSSAVSQFPTRTLAVSHRQRSQRHLDYALDFTSASQLHPPRGTQSVPAGSNPPPRHTRVRLHQEARTGIVPGCVQIGRAQQQSFTTAGLF